MALSQQIVQKQTQRLLMTQDLRQSIELLAMSSTDLLDRIQNELIENPLLEELQEKEGSTNQEMLEIQKNQATIDEDTKSELPDANDWKQDYNNQKEQLTSQINQEKTDIKHQYLENSIRATESLQDHLIGQLRLLDIDKHAFQVGQKIISSINDKGFLSCSLFDLFGTDDEKIISVAKSVLLKIQRLEPIGCGTLGIAEGLFVQAQNLYPDDSLLHQILKEDFDLIEKLEYDKIANKRGLLAKEIEESIKKIKALEPFPGSLYSSARTEYIVADVSVIEYEGELKIIMNDDMIPNIGLNQEYSDALSTTSVSKEDQEYIQLKLTSAQWLLNGLKQRQTTLYKTILSIVKMQKEFFYKGPIGLVPLTLKNVADDIEMHESTISRITSNKYVQTKWGVLQLKYFFSSSVKTSFGEKAHSATSIQSRIKRIIEEENADDPISDQAIVEILLQNEIKIARRTVAKYRNNMNILPVDRRKKLNKIK